jgi:hypothetical protein
MKSADLEQIYAPGVKGRGRHRRRGGGVVKKRGGEAERRGGRTGAGVLVRTAERTGERFIPGRLRSGQAGACRSQGRLGSGKGQ